MARRPAEGSFVGYTDTARSGRGGWRDADREPPRRKQAEEAKQIFEKGDVVAGTVISVNDSGVFVDIGAVKDALLPWSEAQGMAPKVGERLDDLAIRSINPAKKRIYVSFADQASGRREHGHGDVYFFVGGKSGDKSKGSGAKGRGHNDASRRSLDELQEGEEVSGIVKTVQSFGIFVDIGCVKDALLAWGNAAEGSHTAYDRGDRLENLFILSIDRQLERISVKMLEEDSGGELRPPMRRGKGKGKASPKGGSAKGKGSRKGKHGKHGNDYHFDPESERDLMRSLGLDDEVLMRGPPVQQMPLEDVFIGDIVRGKITDRTDSEWIIDFNCEVPGLLPLSEIDYPVRIGDLVMGLKVTGIDVETEFVWLRQVEFDDEEDAPELSSEDDMPSLVSEAKPTPLSTDLCGSENEMSPPSEQSKARQSSTVPRAGARAPHRRYDAEADEEDPLLSSVGHGIGQQLAACSPSPAIQDEDFDVRVPAEDMLDLKELLECVELGEQVEGTVTRVTDAGAYVDFGLPIDGLLPQRLFDWPVSAGDELHGLVISRIDAQSLRVTLSLDSAEVDPDMSPRATGPRRGTTSAVSGVGPGRGGGRGAGGKGCGRGIGGASEEGRGIGSASEGESSDENPKRGEKAALSDNELSNPQDGVSEPSSPQGGVARPLAEAGCPEVAPLLEKIATGQRSAARELAKVIAAAAQPIQTCAIASAALKVLMRKSNCAVASLLGLQELSEKLGRITEPLLVRIIPSIIEKYADKQRSVQVAAEDAAETIVARLNPYGIDAVLPAILGVLKQKEKTEVKAGALRMLALMKDDDTVRPLARKLVDVVPFVAEMLLDVKRDVREAALDAAKVLFECCGNKDLTPYVDDIVDALADMAKIPNCVNQLSEIVFVQTVETQALAIVMPLIVRGLKDRDEYTKRRALVIADNMCKLVPDVSEIQPFLSQLIPLVKRGRDGISNPEVRSVAERCYATLDQADKADRKKQIDRNAVINMIRERVPQEKREPVLDMIIEYVAHLCCSLSACRAFDYPEWWHCITPYLTPQFLTKRDCDDLVPMLLENCYDAAEGDDVEDEDEDGEDLCNCVFTLGYGSLTLLNNTRLHLKRGKCYGLCGPNDCGKSTLLKAIDDERVDGFPPKSELVTAFVEHGIGEKEPESDWTPLEYMFADETIQAMQIPKKKVLAALKSLGFTGLMLNRGIGQLSGGWKMKLGLVRAMLMCADILLLDEPTGHLDSANVAWLAEYITSLARDETRPVSTIVVSHDSAFLDKVCTHIINVRQRKLKTYVGGISDFVRRCPEAKSYVSLDAENKKFVLPEPGMLEGVKSRGKKLLKMKNVTYTYPGNEVPTLLSVSIEVSMLSRVAVIGPNGAGKSTMIKALVGELPCNDGVLWKHPNVRVAYVAQHAFHHIEAHLNKTATQYFLWRFRGGEDVEALDNRAEQERKMKKRKYWLKDGHLVRCHTDSDMQKAVELEAIINRRKSKSKGVGGDEKFEYQVKWLRSSTEHAMWVDREKLVEMGQLRMVQREDEKQAAAHGLIARPLTQPQVEEHLLGFGLDASFASHQRLGILSGGQKVKVVIGAATWLSPHILVLDEPTNYLDRDSLGALAFGLEDFGGGVIIISHNREFADRVCDERWLMNAGRLTREGMIDREDVKLTREIGAEDMYVDEFGNRSVFSRKKSMTEKELKKHSKQKALRRKKGEDVSDDEDEEAWYDDLLEQAAKSRKDDELSADVARSSGYQACEK